MQSFSDAQLRAFLDESLPVDQMAAIEQHLRADPSLHSRLLHLRGEEDAGLHTIGGVWRRNRLSCPSRSDLGRYLLGVLDADYEAMIRFHLERVGCRFCAANLEDLRRAEEETASQTQGRLGRFFQTSAGYLQPHKPKP